MNITKTLRIDLAERQNIPRVDAVQFDSNTRIVSAFLYSGGSPWNVPDNVNVSIAFSKSDGKSGRYDKLPDGSDACDVSGNNIIATLAPEVLSAGGEVSVSMVIQDASTLDQIASFPFTVCVTPSPAAGSGTSNHYYNYKTMDDINNALDSSLMFRGKVVDKGKFEYCSEMGYYTFSYEDIENIGDSFELLKSGGVVKVYPNAARNNTIFQEIVCASGDRWFRYGKHEFEKVGSKWKAVDGLYESMGIVKFGDIVQGAPSIHGGIIATSKSICTKKPIFLGSGVSYSVFLEDGWNYSVTEFDDENASNEGQRNVYMSTDPIFVAKKSYGWIRFNRRNSAGIIEEITPADFAWSAVFRREDKTSSVISDTPENIGVLNAILNAKQCREILYTPIKNLPAQNGDFVAGEEVQGLPYSSTRIDQLYVPNNVSFMTFMSALKNPNSYLYTTALDGVLNNAKTFYGAVCSSFASYALGIKPVYTTALWSKIPGMVRISDQSAYGLKLCDVVWRSGHCMLVTDIKRDSFGRIASVEISEATAATGKKGVVEKTNYSLADFEKKFINGETEYIFYRYKYIKDVKHVPTPIVPVEGESFSGKASYNKNIMGRLGDRFNVRHGNSVEFDILDQEGFSKYKLSANGEVKSLQTISSSHIVLKNLDVGKYSICLTNGVNDSSPVEFIVVDAPAPNVSLVDGSDSEYLVEFSSANATPIYVMWFVDGSTKAAVTQIDNIQDGDTSILTNLRKDSGYVRIALETEFGIILSNVKTNSEGFSGTPVDDSENVEKPIEEIVSELEKNVNDLEASVDHLAEEVEDLKNQEGGGDNSGNITPESIGAIPAPATAKVGQPLVPTEVDETGKPVKWECADVGGGSDYTPAPLPLLADVTSEEALKVFEVALSKRAVKRVIMYITVSSEEPVGAPLYGWINGKTFDCMIAGSTALEAGNTTWMELELMAGGLARFTTSTSSGGVWSQKPINTSGEMQNYAYVDSIGGCLMKSDARIPAGTRIQVWGE